MYLLFLYEKAAQAVKFSSELFISFRIIFASYYIKLSEKPTFYVDVRDVREITPQLEATRERDVKIPTAQSWKGIA